MTMAGQSTAVYCAMIKKFKEKLFFRCVRLTKSKCQPIFHFVHMPAMRKQCIQCSHDTNVNTAVHCVHVITAI